MSIIKLKSFIINKKSELLFSVLILSLLATVVIFNTFYSMTYVNGSSMAPTYSDGEVLVIKKANTLNNDDLVIFESPESWDSEPRAYLKRVIGNNGDRIIIKDGTIAVNGVTVRNQLINCDYDGIIVLGDDEIFVMGDNYSQSNDSFHQLCNGNKDFTVKNEKIIIYGKETLKIGGFR